MYYPSRMIDDRSILSNAGVAASSEERAEQLRQMNEHLTLESANLEAERERSRLSAIEYDRRERVRFEELNLDDVIEIPGREGGETTIIRCVINKGARLRYMPQESG